MREYEEGRRDAAFILGSGFVLWFLWVGTTAAGHVFGQLLGDPQRFGADFMLPAFFATMAAIFFRESESDLASADRHRRGRRRREDGERPLVHPAGALAGSLVGAWRHGRPA